MCREVVDLRNLLEEKLTRLGVDKNLEGTGGIKDDSKFDLN
jgi:hypothetical protein